MTFPSTRIRKAATIYRLAARIIGAPVRISHEYECFGALDRWLVNRTLPQDYSRHAVENNLALLPMLGAQRGSAGSWLRTVFDRGGTGLGGGFCRNSKIFPGVRCLASTSVPAAPRISRCAAGRWKITSNWRGGSAKTGRNSAILFFGGPEEENDHEKIQQQAGGQNLFFPRTRKTCGKRRH